MRRRGRAKATGAIEEGVREARQRRKNDRVTLEPVKTRDSCKEKQHQEGKRQRWTEEALILYGVAAVHHRRGQEHITKQEPEKALLDREATPAGHQSR